MDPARARAARFPQYRRGFLRSEIIHDRIAALTCNDTKRRLCCQAFFATITITEDHRIATESAGVYDTIIGPEVGLHTDYYSSPRFSRRRTTNKSGAIVWQRTK